MRATISVFALVLSVSAPAVAQDWIEYQNVQDGFKINFPGQPKIAATTWASEFGYTLPARVYSAELPKEKYTLTVVDYRGIEPQGEARKKACPAGAEPCIGSDLSGGGYWKHDVRGMLIFAPSKSIQGPGKVTHYLWNHQDLVEGAELQITNPDESRTLVFISAHQMKLYVMEGTVAKGRPEPGLFQNSMGWVDEKGQGVRYQSIYANQFHALEHVPPPPVARRGGGGGARGGAGRDVGAGNQP